MIRIFFILFFISCIICSCNKKSSVPFDEKLILEIANESTEFPSKYNSLTFFGICEKNKVRVLSVNELRFIHKKKYNQMKYKDFLSQVFNQKLDINYVDKIKCFELDQEVTNKYNDSSNVEEFIGLYSKKNNQKNHILKNDIPEKKLITIMYYLFLNNYLVTFDDYIGIYFIEKTSSVL